MHACVCIYLAVPYRKRASQLPPKTDALPAYRAEASFFFNIKRALAKGQEKFIKNNPTCIFPFRQCLLKIFFIILYYLSYLY